MVHEKLKIQLPGSFWQADLYTYFLDNSIELHPNRTRPVIIICPGGGYHMTSDREAEGIAIQFLAAGFHAAVLRYSVEPARYPEALGQLAKTILFLRENAEKYHIDKDKIIVQGSSAGGHLAASMGVFWNKPFLAERLGTDSEMLRPNGLILSYPVISSGKMAHVGSFENLLGEDYRDEEKRRSMSLELCVTKDTPKTFLWHTAPDDTVPVENSLLFFQALHKLGIPTEMHIYPVGGHGLGLANEETSSDDGYGVQEECQSWIELACDWIRHL
ncbi:MAG: alpha/beta hydrolase [Eubacteriales bacterium]|nr:alpha/beta hydrolase [Eubacteriales bacterium]